MNNAARGTYLERQTIAALERYSWLVVRAAGSHGPADLVALRKGHQSLLVQCKITGPGRTMPRIDPAERIALYDAAEKAGARAIIATRFSGGRITIMELLGPGWTQFPTVDVIAVPSRPGKTRAEI